jgi:hypothetical protein
MIASWLSTGRDRKARAVANDFVKILLSCYLH